jgi:predicted PurR-regulated permease PerM
MTASTDNLVPRGVIGGGARLGYALVALGGLVLFCYGLYVTAWLVNTLVLTLLLALVVSPILFNLQRRGWPAWAAVLGAFLVVFGITLAFVALALVSLSRFDDNLPFYQQRVTEIANNVAARFGLTNPPVYDLSQVPADFAQRMIEYVVPLAFSIVGLVGSLVLYMFLLLYAFGEVFVMPARLRNMTGGNPVVLDLLRRFGEDMRSFFKMNAFVGAIAAILDVIVLLFMGVDFVLLWGLLSFLMSFIPNIGFIISMIAPALMALIQFGPWEALMVIVAYCAINLVIDYVLRPRLIGRDINQSQIVTFLGVMLWGALLGPTGALLSVPLTLILKLLLEVATGTPRYSALIVEEIPTEDTNGTIALVVEKPVADEPTPIKT